jgi:hypothetical protein
MPIGREPKKACQQGFQRIDHDDAGRTDQSATVGGSFLVELARNDSPPLDVRRRAVVIARPFPIIEDVSPMVQFTHSSGLGMGLGVSR